MRGPVNTIRTPAWMYVLWLLVVGPAKVYYYLLWVLPRELYRRYREWRVWRQWTKGR